MEAIHSKGASVAALQLKCKDLEKEFDTLKGENQVLQNALVEQRKSAEEGLAIQLAKQKDASKREMASFKNAVKDAADRKRAVEVEAVKSSLEMQRAAECEKHKAWIEKQSDAVLQTLNVANSSLTAAVESLKREADTERARNFEDTMRVVDSQRIAAIKEVKAQVEKEHVATLALLKQDLVSQKDAAIEAATVTARKELEKKNAEVQDLRHKWKAEASSWDEKKQILVDIAECCHREKDTAEANADRAQGECDLLSQKLANAEEDAKQLRREKELSEAQHQKDAYTADLMSLLAKKLNDIALETQSGLNEKLEVTLPQLVTKGLEQNSSLSKKVHDQTVELAARATQLDELNQKIIGLTNQPQ